MHSPIEAASKHNCDGRANYWQLSVSLSLSLSLRHKSAEPLPRAAFNYAGRPNAVEGFIRTKPEPGDERSYMATKGTTRLLGAIRVLPRNVAVTRDALAAFQLRRSSSNLLIDK